MSNNSLPTLNKNGFSLLEVLISIFILAIGLLGLAALQTTSLKNNHSAQHRTSATVLAYDILDRMRLNPTLVLLPSRRLTPNANYARAMGDALPAGGIVGDDLLEWTETLGNELPSGDGAIAINGNIITVTVQWDDSRGDSIEVQDAPGAYDGTRSFIVRTEQ